MRKSIIALTLLLFSVASIQAQKTQYERISLKSGIIYQGIVSEYNPNGTTTIVLVDGRSVSVETADIEDYKPLQTGSPKPKEIGYFNLTAFGLQVGNATYGPDVSLNFTMLNGYKYKRSFFAVGTGFQNYMDELYVPLFLDYAYNFSSEGFTPYASVQAGLMINPGSSEEYNYFYWNPTQYNNGYMLGLEAGIRSQLNSHLGLNISMGYQYTKFSTESYDRYIFQDIAYPVVGEAMMHRFNIKLGLMIN